MTAPVMVGPSPQSGRPTPCPDWDEVLADIGDRIRAERQARSWSQTELGRRAGVGLVTVKRLEAGISSLKVFAQACFALEVDMSYVLSDQWRMPARRLPLTPRQVELLGAVAGGQRLSDAAFRLGIPREGLAARLSKIYTQLGLSDVPKDERRSAALRIAVQHGLIDAA